MIEMKTKLSTLKSQLLDNKLKFKKTSTEWTLNYILKKYKDENDFDKIFTLAKIVNIVPVTNVWPELGASAVKRVKSRQRSSMKNDLLNALLHITLNGPPVNGPEAESLINRVTEDYSKQSHRKTPKIYAQKWIGNTMSTQTEMFEIDDDVEDLISKISEKNEQDTNFLPTNIGDDDSSSDDSEDDESEMD